MSSLLDLSALQKDLLVELFNQGIGGAANSLSQLLNQEIILSVPVLLFESPQQLADRLGQNNNVFSICQQMDGPFLMHSMIVFTPEDGFNVVKQLLDEHLSDEILAELQSEALTEIGNIVLNACIGVIAEALDEQFIIQLPVFNACQTSHLLTGITESSLLLSILVKMEIKNKAVNGHLIFILNTDSMLNLHKTLDSILARYY